MGDILFMQRKRLWCGLPWTFTVYSFDSERLFIKSGMLNIKEDEIRLYRILDLNVLSFREYSDLEQSWLIVLIRL